MFRVNSKDIRSIIDLENMELLGSDTEGQNSEVYLAVDKQLNQQFIVKKMKKKDISRNGNKDEDDQDLFFKESRTLYKVNHPNIAEIQYASYDRKNIYLVMPYYNRGSAYSLLKKRNLKIGEFIKISLEFLSGLFYIHSINLVHLDIKPTNILINNNGKAVLSDFGLSKYLDKHGLIEYDCFYNCHRPPESFITEKLGKPADLYQAGVTMYRLVNGCSVWNSQIAEIRSIEDLEDRIKNGSLPRRDVYLPHIPYKIRKIINRCLEINVKKRYDNVLDIINDLSGVDCEVDWQYEKTSSSEKWSCYRPEDIEISIVLTPKGQLYELYTIINDLKCSKIFKVDEMCKDNITKKDAYYKIENYINN